MLKNHLTISKAGTMLDARVSRRKFLELTGAGATVLVLGKILDYTSLFKSNSRVASSLLSPSGLLPEASAQSAGSWALGPPSSITPIHMAMLQTGRILILAGSGYHASNTTGPYQASLLDPNTGVQVGYTLSEDVFCGGHAHLSSGKVLVAGGTLSYDVNNPDGLFHGLKSAYEFDVYTSTFNKVSSMAAGRWYPTLLALPNGKVLVGGGLDEYGINNFLIEVYDPASKTFSILYDPSSSGTYCVGQGSNLPGAGSVCFGGPNKGVGHYISLYPRMHVMPSGLAAVCGQNNLVYTIDSNSGTWTYGGSSSQPLRSYGFSFLLPLNNTLSERGKVLIGGGQVGATSPAFSSCELLDFNSGTDTQPVIRSTASLSNGRQFPSPVILPNGKLVVFGGSSGLITNYVYTPEMFDPIAETWTTLPNATVPRTYHSTAVLLLDGRVWTASGTPDRINWEYRTEVYSPSYVFATRPTISGRVSSAPYGGTIRIPTPNAADITSVSLLRLQTSTHHYDANQRLVWLQITSKESAAVLVSAPINANIAPPGPYIIHVINSSGIPSVSQIIRLPGTTC